MNEQIADFLLRIRYVKQNGIRNRYRSRIADLTAGFAVKRRLVRNNRGFLSFGNFINFFAVNQQSGNLSFGLRHFIAQKFRAADFSLTSNHTASVADSPEPAQALRASAF